MFWTSETVYPILCLFQTKLNNGEACLSAAHPYDVATLIKQFCRELPEPLFPSEFQTALLKSQTLPNAKDKTSALQLLSCLLPARSSSCLHYLFSFLSRISQRFAVYVKHRVLYKIRQKLWALFLRCEENLMTSSNLATIFAPCLLPPPNKAEMSESRLELRVLVLRAFTENPHLFGNIVFHPLIWAPFCLELDLLGLINVCQVSSLNVSWTVWNFWQISRFPMMQKRDKAEDTVLKVNNLQIYSGCF